MFGLYTAAMMAATPLLRRVLARRLARGKEDPTRLEERRGIASLPRPAGPLVWIHAASVGEALSIQPLLERVLARDPAVTVLLTTGTVTSAEMMAARLPPRALHQFVPLDHPRWVARFLAHWRPDAVLWVESEFWPGMLGALQRAGTPMALVNGRLSARSFRRWRRMRPALGVLLRGFGPVLMQSPAMVERIRRLGAPQAVWVGNLKYSVASPPGDPVLGESLSRWARGGPVVAALSLHPGEETVLLQAFRALHADRPEVRLVIVPRHPDRAAAIAARLEQSGVRVWQVAPGAAAGGAQVDAPVAMVGRIGVTGSVLGIAQVAVIGGTFIAHGGHNPIEPAQARVPIVHGPSMENFAEVAQDLAEAGAALRVEGADALAAALRGVLSDPARAAALVAAASGVVARYRDTVDRVMAAIAPVLPPVSAAAPGDQPEPVPTGWPVPAPGAERASGPIGGSAVGLSADSAARFQ